MKFLSSTLYRLRHILVISGISLSVMSCGGGASVTAGISGTGITFGEVTGFGSVLVNGVKYEIENTVFDVDGDKTATQSNLKVGMVVRINWSSFDDGTFEADELVYDDSVEGPITSPVTLVTGTTTKKEFDVLDNHVIVDASSTSFQDSTSSPSSFNFDSIAQDDVIEVSGFIDGSGNILATLIEKKGSQSGGGPVRVELHVTVPSPSPSGSFIVGNLTINYDVNCVTTICEDVPNNVLTAGLKIEVEGSYDGINTIEATKIEGEDDEGIGSDPNLSISIQGSVSGLNVDNTAFTINGPTGAVTVEIVAAAIPVLQPILDQLVEGLNVEVEGLFDNNGVLKTNEIEIRESEAEYRAIVRSKDATAQTLNIGYPNVFGELVMQIDSQSTIVDEDQNPISLSDVLVDDDVKISARIVDTDHTVIRLRRQRGENRSYEITGEVQAFTSPNGPITIEDLVFQLDSNVTFDISFGSPPNILGRVVELEDCDDINDNCVRDGDIDQVATPG